MGFYFQSVKLSLFLPEELDYFCVIKRGKNKHANFTNTVLSGSCRAQCPELGTSSHSE